ncbi:hypothetical protein CVT24_012607 [Panaeolus cyanescens]|uniref:XPG-I domain-containing protein n=1 Tax=Panaeolus cyanescens TaxID=181874 RepID=A0A409YJR9_9AGAR|nr:hypothetical protein CVT24_012607 [Panaeolus cyanescens]
MSPKQQTGSTGKKVNRQVKRRQNFVIQPSKPPTSALKVESVDTGPNTLLLHSALYTMDNDENIQSIPESTITTNTPLPLLPSFSAHDKQQNALVDRVHAEALQRDEDYRADRALHGTERSYPRHFNNYVLWWEKDQLAQKAEWDEQCKLEAEAQMEQRREAGLPEPPNLPPLEPFPFTPAEPITATKACLFLHYELSREKRGPGGKTSLPNTTVGKSSIKQTINSLEYYRFKRSRFPEYLAVPESQVKLRADPRICAIERSSQTGEAKRQEISQEMKAKGVSSATFTTDELVLMSKDYLLNPIGASKRTSIMIALRNRTMLLFSTSMAFRGDNTRRILLSDLNVEEVSMPGKDGTDQDRRVKALVVMSNQGKTNTTGRIDKHYAFRHRNVHLCPVSALAMHLFCLWHVFGRSPPDFIPSYTDKRASGDHGYRAWYSILLFPPLRSATSDDTVPMAYETHRKQCNDQKERLNLSHHASTHGGRSYTATTAIALGASTDSVRALGNWSFTGSWSLYNHSLPIDAMVAAAGCNGHQVDSYFVSRELIVPPNELICSIFPWLSVEERAYNHRLLEKKEAKDGALRYLLNLLLYLRLVLVQDAAVLYQENPECPIFEFAPFNSDLFRSFAQETVKNIYDAEEHRRQYLQNLPANMQESFRGSLESNRLQSLEHQRRIEESHRHMSSSFGAMCGLMHTTIQVISAFADGSSQGSSSRCRKRKALDEPSDLRSSIAELQRAAQTIVASHTVKQARYHPPAQPEAITINTNQRAIQNLAPPSDLADANIDPTLLAISTTTTAAATAATPLMDLSNQPLPIPIASGLGTIYSDQTFPVSRDNPDLFAHQIKALTDLENKFGSGKLKAHVFEWKGSEWLPKDIRLWKPPMCSTGEPIIEMTIGNAGQQKFFADAIYDIRIDSVLRGGRAIPCVGIDLSVLMDSCIAASISQGLHGQSGALQMFFNRLLLFSGVRATFVFVFDGPNRPAVKRGHQVRHNIWWSGIVQDMILMFGFRTHNAPGEAEAELAHLNHTGFIDAVFTTDGDALVFGAQTVIRLITEPQPQALKWNDCVEVFTSARVQSLAHLSTGGLLLFALLTGGDYDQSGLVNCGQVTALALCQCGFGDELLDAVHTHLINSPNEDAFDIFLLGWRDRVCNELRFNSHRYLSYRRPDLANTINSTAFPDREVLMLYVFPVTSLDGALPALIAPAALENVSQSWYLIHEPMVKNIAEFCRSHLYLKEARLTRRLVQQVFPSIVLRMLYSPIYIYDTSSQKLIGPTLQVTITNIKWVKRKGKYASRYGTVAQPKLTVNVVRLLLLSGVAQAEAGKPLVINVWASRRELPNGLESLYNRIDG